MNKCYKCNVTNSVAVGKTFNMSGLMEFSVTYFQLFCIKAVKFSGRLPKHVAIIMDGSRRYAKKVSISGKCVNNMAFDKFLEVLKWCLHLGIPEMTVFAFSIDNFKRTKEEIDTLQDVAREKFTRLLEEVDHLKELGIRMNFVGRMSLIPEDLRVLFNRIMLATRHHNKLRINFACAYTGRDEMSRTAEILVQAVQNKKIEPQDIDETLVSQTMELGEPELLIRTSGEVRLSDFMLWQISSTKLHFCEVLWPEFSVYNFLAALINFRRYAPESKETEKLSLRQQQFLKNLETQRWKDLEKNTS